VDESGPEYAAKPSNRVPYSASAKFVLLLLAVRALVFNSLTVWSSACMSSVATSHSS